MGSKKKATTKSKAQLCKEEVEEVMKRYNCKVDVSMIISSKNDTPMFNVDFVEVKGD